MKQRVLYGLLCASLLVAGCASQPARTSGGISGFSGPQIVLPGGEVEDARLLAMGMARSKGWTIAEADANRLLLKRKLPKNSPQAQMLSPQGVLTPPTLQVETRLWGRGSDVIAGLSSYLIANPGTEQERRIDYTADYQDQLMISLNALASAWLENRTRIASEIPLPPDSDTVVIADAGPIPQPDTAAESAQEPSQEVSQEPSQEPPLEAPSTPTIPAIDTTPSAATVVASPTPQPTTMAQQPSPTGDPNEMLVLDTTATSPRGLWTFYAEASARERGCEPNERGAVMLRSNQDSELYEIQCTNGSRQILSCQGGICRDRS